MYRFISIQKFINYDVNRKRFLKCQGYCTKGHGHRTKGQSHWQNKNQVKMQKKKFHTTFIFKQHNTISKYKVPGICMYMNISKYVKCH